MKKNILSLIAIASVSTLLIGCGGGGGDEDGGTPIDPEILDENITAISLYDLDVSGDLGYMLSVNIDGTLDPADNITYYFCEDKFGDATPGVGVPVDAKYNYLATYENSRDYDIGFIQNVNDTSIWLYSQIGREGFGVYPIISNNGLLEEGNTYDINFEGTIEINGIATIDCSTIPQDS